MWALDTGVHKSGAVCSSSRPAGEGEARREALALISITKGGHGHAAAMLSAGPSPQVTVPRRRRSPLVVVSFPGVFHKNGVRKGCFGGLLPYAGYTRCLGSVVPCFGF